MTWLVTLRAEDFSINSLRTPAVSKEDASEDPDALFLEKMYLTELGLDMLDELYRQFLSVRLAPEWNREAAAVTQWIRHDISQGTMQPQV